MGWFENRGGDADTSRWRQSYDYVQQSPTMFGAIMTLIWCVSAVLSKTESFGTVAGPGFTALLFLFHNIHVRKAHREVSDALEEARSARVEVQTAREHIETTHQELSLNTEHTMTAAASAAQAAASVARIEALTRQLDAKIDALHTKAGQK